MNIFILLGKILNGEGTEKDLQAHRVFKKEKSTKILTEELEWIWAKTASLRPDFVTEPNQAWEQLRDKLESSSIIRRNKVRFTKVAVALAASLLLFFTAHIFFVETDNQIRVAAELKKSVTTLPDGSKIWLNKSSSFIYDESKNERMVDLIGEGYFEVSPDQQRPFIITSSGLRTVVVGTTFNINEMISDKTIISLFTGKLKLVKKDSSSEETLSAGHQIIFNAKSRELVKTAITNPNILSWKTGILVFENTPILEAIQVIEQHFDIELEWDKSQSQSRITATFNNQPIEEVLELIHIITDIEVKVSETQRSPVL